MGPAAETGAIAAAGCLLAVAALWQSPSPAGEPPRVGVAELEGRYARTHRLPMLDGMGVEYLAEDWLEIDRIDDRRARVRLTTYFPNGHSCSLEGKAMLRRGALVLTERHRGADGRRCRLAVRRQGGSVRWSDGGGSCASYCGMRGSLNGSVPYAARAAPR